MPINCTKKWWEPKRDVHFAWKDILFELLGWTFKTALDPWFTFDLRLESKYFVM